MTYALGGQRAVRVALASLLLAASAACSPSSADKDRAGPTATVAIEPPRTTTTNPYAVPAVIDIAYVNRVLAGLDAVFGDATRSMIRTKTITADVYDRLRAIYGSNDLLQLVLDLIQEEMHSGFRDYKPSPGNKLTIANQVISSGPTCVFVRVHRDYSAVALGSSNPVNPQWIALKPLESSRDPNRYNPTTWAIVYDGFPQDRSQPANPCTG